MASAVTLPEPQAMVLVRRRLLDVTMTMIPLLTLSVTRQSMRTGHEGRVEAGHNAFTIFLTQVFIMSVSLNP